MNSGAEADSQSGDEQQHHCVAMARTRHADPPLANGYWRRPGRPYFTKPAMTSDAAIEQGCRW